MSLEPYKKKRDFTRTSEPEEGTSTSGKRLVFVVQRHAARRLHFDFRLEMEGVLKSWAVPKGPSLNPSDKRLAVMVEDHPFDYRTFEGTIPKGSYGAGEVKIWDEGYYEPLKRKKDKTDDETLQEELKNGSIKIILHGKKLKGEFALVRMHNAKEENAWLLIKHNDEHAVKEPYDAENETPAESTVTRQADKKQHIAKKSPSRKERPPTLRSAQRKLSVFKKPMLASKSEAPFNGPEWLFEIKWDGYRAIAEVGDEIKFYSRNGLSFLDRFPAITSALELQEHEMILDGEIVAYNEEGKPDFQTLQHYDENPQAPILFHVFDLLFLNGHSTVDLTLQQRKELLKEALTETAHLKYCDHVENEGKAFFKTIQDADLEGMIAKQKASTYHEGRRSMSWLKIKNHKSDDAVIAGFTQPRGSRKYFGSLILGQYREGKLQYVGHVGTGFNEKSLKEIHSKLKPMVTEVMPFDTKPATNMPPTWVKPELVAVVKYTQLTEDGSFRHPVFMGIREEIDALNLYQDSLSDTQQPDKRMNSTDYKSSSAGKKEVVLTNQDKLYWKKEKITKGDLIDYYLSVSDFILPHLKERAQSLHRFPDGIDGPGFYHKDAGKDAPSWVPTVRIFSESNKKEIEYIICNDKDTLGYLINLGCIELNPWSNRLQNPERPDFLIIDLDPSKKNSFGQVVEVAKTTKELLDSANIPAWCKTSGSTGIHIYIPLGARYAYDVVRDFAHIIVQLVQQRLPRITTLERSLKKRGPKIYLDYLQNRTGQTVASVYSVRPRPGAPVSMPIEWDELTNDLSIRDFTIKNTLARLTQKGDIFLPVLGEGVDLGISLGEFLKHHERTHP